MDVRHFALGIACGCSAIGGWYLCELVRFCLPV
jgi:hypothetical protein